MRPKWCELPTDPQGELAIVIGPQPQTPAWGKAPALPATNTYSHRTHWPANTRPRRLGRVCRGAAWSKRTAAAALLDTVGQRIRTDIRSDQTCGGEECRTNLIRPGQELRRRRSPSEHARCRGREDCKPCPCCGDDGDGTHHGEDFPPEI